VILGSKAVFLRFKNICLPLFAIAGTAFNTGARPNNNLINSIFCFSYTSFTAKRQPIFANKIMKALS